MEHYCPCCGSIMTYYWTVEHDKLFSRLVCMNKNCRRVYDRSVNVLLGVLKETHELYAR